jgi:hypothetical protein
MKTFITFGGGLKYEEAAYRIRDEVIQTKIFDEVIAYTGNDLACAEHSEFYSNYQNFMHSNSRGYGFMIWKSYLINYHATKMNDGDYLIFSDAGCIVGSKIALEYAIDALATEEFIAYYASHANKPYCSKILRQTLLTEQIDDQPQIASTTLFLELPNQPKL